MGRRIVNDVSHVSRINHESHVAWQVQYLVKLEVGGAKFHKCRE